MIILLFCSSDYDTGICKPYTVGEDGLEGLWKRGWGGILGSKKKMQKGQRSSTVQTILF